MSQAEPKGSKRRVVVTGLGLLCGVGNTAPEVWQQLLAGASGMGPIQSFDTTGFPVNFAAEVKHFDPLNFVEKKEARKMGRFIHFAFAAVDEAEVTPGASFQEDLGADSLDVVELVMQFEEAFDLEIPDEDAEKIKTVKDAIDYIEKNAKGGK